MGVIGGNGSAGEPTNVLACRSDVDLNALFKYDLHQGVCLEVTMIIDDTEKVKCSEIQEKDISGVRMKVLISENDGAPNFVMREFAVEAGGHTAYHTHEWEHEVYVLDGKGAVKQGETEYLVKKGSFVLVKPNEEHQFINKGHDTFRFICVVPHIKTP
jgi:quercetin dioxygenase-like cupin family protein